MNYIQSSLSLRLILTLSLVSCALSSATAQDDGPLPANYVLQPIELSGNSSLLKWTNLTSRNTDLQSVLNTGTQTYLGTHPDTNTTGALSLTSPGYLATGGLYSIWGDYGAVIATNNNGSPIRNVVIQAASMYNGDAGSLANQLNYNHLLYFDEDDVRGGSPNPNDPGGISYDYSPELAALAELIDNYQGGPILTWYDSHGNFGHLAATISGILSSMSDIEIPGAPFQGDYYSFAWQWDLSEIEDVVSISATLPIMRHVSTLGLQVDLSDTYLQIVPEPGTYAAILGGAGLVFLLIRRRKALKAV